MSSNNHGGAPNWRSTTTADLDVIQRIGDQIHVDLPERPEDTILSKPLWPKFQTRFANQETLATKFNQLAGTKKYSTPQPLGRRDHAERRGGRNNLVRTSSAKVKARCGRIDG